MADDLTPGDVLDPPPRTKYRLDVTIYGNTHEEVVDELLSLTRGGYLLGTDYYERHETHIIGGRRTMRLEHTNPDQTPENYSTELAAWADRKRAQ